MSEAYMDCDRNICYQNEVNGIDCDKCPVTEAYRKQRYKIVVDVENIVCACDNSYVTYECYVPALANPGDNPGFSFYLRGTALKSWPEYVYSLKLGNCIIFNHLPEDTSDCIKERYHIADSHIDYYYRIKEIADELPEM